MFIINFFNELKNMMCNYYDLYSSNFASLAVGILFFILPLLVTRVFYRLGKYALNYAMVLVLFSVFILTVFGPSRVFPNLQLLERSATFADTQTIALVTVFSDILTLVILQFLLIVFLAIFISIKKRTRVFSFDEVFRKLVLNVSVVWLSLFATLVLTGLLSDSFVIGLPYAKWVVTAASLSAIRLNALAVVRQTLKEQDAWSKLDLNPETLVEDIQVFPFASRLLKGKPVPEFAEAIRLKAEKLLIQSQNIKSSRDNPVTDYICSCWFWVVENRLVVGAAATVVVATTVAAYLFLSNRAFSGSSLDSVSIGTQTERDPSFGNLLRDTEVIGGALMVLVGDPFAPNTGTSESAPDGVCTKLLTLYKRSEQDPDLARAVEITIVYARSIIEHLCLRIPEFANAFEEDRDITQAFLAEQLSQTDDD